MIQAMHRVAVPASDLHDGEHARARGLFDVKLQPQTAQPLKGALIPIVALTRGFPLAPFGWSGTRGPFP
jgi:hypothetical protein